MKLPMRQDYGHGCYRRRIDVRVRPDRAVAELEDDFHQFGVDVRFDGDRVRDISARSERFPWTTCPAASQALEIFVGVELDTSLSALARLAEPDRQCTHQLDLACLAIASRALGIEERRYDAAVPELSEGKTRVSLSIDGETSLEWALQGMTIASPEPFSGRRLGGGFSAWVESEFSAEQAIEAHVLRRATYIGFGRQYDFDAMPDPVEFAAATGSRCHSFHPSVIRDARRVVGSGRRYDDRPGELLRRSCVDRDF